MKITEISGREVLDSSGNPTVEAEITLADGTTARGILPSQKQIISRAKMFLSALAPPPAKCKKIKRTICLRSPNRFLLRQNWLVYGKAGLANIRAEVLQDYTLLSEISIEKGIFQNRYQPKINRILRNHETHVFIRALQYI